MFLGITISPTSVVGRVLARLGVNLASTHITIDSTRFTLDSTDGSAKL